MNKFIVCTSINLPTEAIKKYDKMSEWTLVVVGDKRTPPNYKLSNGVYLSPVDQEKISKELSDLIGWNCIQRRNFGLLYALNSGADLISTVDDDNIPLDSWGKEIFVNQFVKLKEFQTKSEVFDPIGATNYNTLWHRGFPLELISSRNNDDYKYIGMTPSIQANFWNGDPDIDAICRLEHRPECEFDDTYFPFTSNRLSPFNSQNTILSREVAAEYFLFPHVGRMDDIWAAYYVQSLGFKVVYDKSTVYQDRNAHNLIEDMKKEYLGYENNLNLVKDLILDPTRINNYLPERTRLAWSVYRNSLK
jgi:hypothetical protein